MDVRTSLRTAVGGACLAALLTACQGAATTGAADDGDAPPAVAVSAPAGPAGAVYARLVKAGVELGAPSDTTEVGCPMKCRQRVEAGVVAIYVFPSDLHAQQFVQTLGPDGHAAGPIVLSWLAREASEEQRKAMVAALA